MYIYYYFAVEKQCTSTVRAEVAVRYMACLLQNKQTSSPTEPYSKIIKKNERKGKKYKRNINLDMHYSKAKHC